MLLGTTLESELKERDQFQSPERIHAFGNNIGDNPTDKRPFQSPERIHAFGNILDFLPAVPVQFQSPERIHAFGNFVLTSNKLLVCRFNPQRGFMLLGTTGRTHYRTRAIVSIPREDSCFWEPLRS